MKKPNLKKLDAQCREFNAKHPIGTGVLYHPVIGEEPGRFTTTRSQAYILSGHTAVIFVDQVSGCVALDAIEVPK